jgi:hypothetical protein
MAIPTSIATGSIGCAWTPKKSIPMISDVLCWYHANLIGVQPPGPEPVSANILAS